MLAMPSADVLAQLIALSQMNAAASGNKKKKKNKRPVVTSAPAAAAPAPAASSSKGNKKKKQKQKKPTPAPTTQAPTTVQVTTQAPEAASVFEEEGSGGFGGNSFEGMDMSQFDTYDYGYEDDERSEESQDSFQIILSRISTC